ncbi:hypothetical protein PpBr36_07526 [Pyricularia pennisetigena]|uniref:hypothetical protein n=1 Tax=Pyricularia pennisetigena TaxID=1578925 RepID=UPI00114DB253|nr:hypothetical protein PpBr36_07526 [Pyricularia pennisetigena]TLS25352.1 hypothetical protein PpBr36_07526 [Pyricularia pennisetigena]
MSGGWNTIESDAGVFTYLLEELGVKGVQFEELLTLEPESLASLHPVYGVIFLFKYPTDQPYRAEKPLDGDFDHDAADDGTLFFASQTIQNACGTQALLSVLLNRTADVEIGPALSDFREFTMPLPAEFRGEALSNSDLIRGVHNSFARSSPFADETARPADADSEDAFHFIAYTAAAGRLWELDGLQPAPISHGPCDGTDGEDFANKVMAVLQRRMQRYESSEIRFNLLAMCRDLRLRAAELGDAEAAERERRKRREWRFENALRRHNFVGFAGEVLRGVVAAKVNEGGGSGGNEAYDKWVEQAKQKMVKRIGDRSERKRSAGGGGDFEMAG